MKISIPQDMGIQRFNLDILTLILFLIWIQQVCTCSTLTVKGPFDWHSGQDPTFTSEYEFWKKGPKIAPHLLQSYFTCCNWGKTPERLVTTPPIRIIVFKWICLLHRSQFKVFPSEKNMRMK
ncbi:hypothetical protein V8G54_015366 [Vigna mungo]|uniref:Uncharacterized protein n=1 Tax=Vigna mungo TaxID=3915 RepID=A0AAQ3NL05_VIGMU